MSARRCGIGRRGGADDGLLAPAAAAPAPLPEPPRALPAPSGATAGALAALGLFSTALAYLLFGRRAACSRPA